MTYSPMARLVGIIDTVHRGGESFMVWPRSHRRVFHKYKRQYSCRNEAGENDFTREYEVRCLPFKLSSTISLCSQS